jgi:hypothetical protein
MSIGRHVCWFALGAQILLALSFAKQWLFVGTYAVLCAFAPEAHRDGPRTGTE